MSTLAEFPQGIPFSAEEIRSALESVAIPGWTGSVQLQVLIDPEAAKYISIAVVRREASPAESGTRVARQVLPDPTRKKPVESVLEAIKDKLRIRTVLTALDVHVDDGVLKRKIIQE